MGQYYIMAPKEYLKFESHISSQIIFTFKSSGKFYYDTMFSLDNIWTDCFFTLEL